MGNVIGSGSDGIGGFFDLDTIVDKLSRVQQRKIRDIEKKQDVEKNHSDLYHKLGDFLTNNLQTSIDNLQNAFNKLSYKVSTSNPAILTANSTDSHELYPTTHTLVINTLAQAESTASAVAFTSNNQSLNISDNLTVTLGASSFVIPVATTDTLEMIRDNINNNAIGVTAAILSTNATDGSAQYNLIVSSDKTGSANQLTITEDTGTQFDFSNVMVPAQDATFTFDNLNVVRSSNYVSDVIDGLAFNLLSTTPIGQPVTLTVASSAKELNQDIISAFGDMIKNYNQLLQFIDQSMAERDSRDDSLPLVKISIQNAMNAPYAGTTDVTTLLQIGVTLDNIQTLNATDGTVYKTSGELKLNCVTLRNELETDFSSVQAMMTDPDQGLLQSLTTLVCQLKSGGGPVGSQMENIRRNIRYYDGKIMDEHAHLNTLQEDIRAKYAVANRIIHQLEDTSNFLELQLNNMFSNNHKRK